MKAAVGSADDDDARVIRVLALNVDPACVVRETARARMVSPTTKLTVKLPVLARGSSYFSHCYTRTARQTYK